MTDPDPYEFIISNNKRISEAIEPFLSNTKRISEVLRDSMQFPSSSEDVPVGDLKFIQKILIKNFRGFSGPHEINFATPNGKKGSGLTVICGPNNSGKTSIIEAIAIKDININNLEKHHNGLMRVSIEYKDGKHFEIKDDGMSIKGSEVKLTKNEKAEDFGHYPVNMISYKRDFSSSNNEHPQINDPNFVTNIRDEITGQQFIDLLYSINEKGLKEKYNDLIKKFIPAFSDLDIEFSQSHGYLIKYLNKDQKHYFEHPVQFSGRGLISILVICAYFLLDEKRIIVIDEPETSLHPTSQKKLSEYISKISTKRQVILCTHSPNFIKWEDLKNGAELVRLSRSQKGCEVTQLQKNKRYYELITRDSWEKPYAFDIATKEFFFSEKLLILEGQEDVGLIKKHLILSEKRIDFDIFGYGAAGADNIKNIMELCKDLGIKKVAAIYDGDKKKTAETDKKNFPDYKIIRLSTQDIRDKSNKQGLFNADGTLKEECKDYFENIINAINTYFAE